MIYKLNADFIKKIFVLTFTTGLIKIFFFILPYITNSLQFNEFNKMYYTASLAAVIGGLGFNYAYAQKRFKIIKVLLFILLNLALIYSILYSIKNINSYYSFIVSFSLIVFELTSFYLLYNNFIKEYFIVYSILLISYITIVFAAFININLVIAFSLLTFIASIISLYFIIKTDKRIINGNSKSFYKIGFTAFIINSVSPFIFIADKFIVNTFFNIETANAYTFAWTLTAPIFYLGVIFEKYIYTLHAGILDRRKIIFVMLLLFFLLFIYWVLINLFLSFGITILPETINLMLLKNIINIMLPGFMIFTIIHYPMNGYLFKKELLNVQYKLSVIYLIIIFLLLILFFILTRIELNNNYLLILFLTWGVLGIILSIKYIFIKSRTKIEY